MEGGEVCRVAADLMEGIAGFVAAASVAERGLLAEEVTTKAAGWELAIVLARQESGRRQIGRRMFVPPSTMASGIRSATPVVPRVRAKGAIPEDWRTQASPLVTREVPMALGILLARQASRRTEEETRPISADPSVGRPASLRPPISPQPPAPRPASSHRFAAGDRR